MVDWSPQISVGLAKTAEIGCDVDANPPANVSWSRVDPDINQTTLISSRKGADVLVLGNAQKAMGGTYVCVAVNSLGNASAYVDITVIGTSKSQGSK